MSDRNRPSKDVRELTALARAVLDRRAAEADALAKLILAKDAERRRLEEVRRGRA